MQPVVMNFCKRVNKAQSISQILLLLANHPRLITCLAKFHNIRIINNQPVILMNGIKYPCSKRTLADNLLEDTKSLTNGEQFHDVDDPMSPAYHHPIDTTPTSSANAVSQSLNAKIQTSSQAIAKHVTNPINIFGSGLDKVSPAPSTVSVSQASNSGTDVQANSMIADSYTQSILANYNPKLSMEVKAGTTKLVNQAMNSKNPKLVKKQQKKIQHQKSSADMKKRFKSAFSSSPSATSANQSNSGNKTHMSNKYSSSTSNASIIHSMKSNQQGSKAVQDSKVSKNSESKQQSQALNGTSPFE